MNVLERIADGVQGLVLSAFVALGSFAVWLVRRVLTNQQEIALLKQDLEARDKQRSEDREALSDVRESVKRIEGWIMERGK